MDSTTAQDVIPSEISLETLIPLVVLLVIIFYCLIIAVVFIFFCTRYPHRLKQSPPGGAIPEPVSFTDCSFILQCFPCTACSPRKALRGCCPDTGSLRRLVDCELIRPRPRASGVDLVCCVVCES